MTTIDLTKPPAGGDDPDERENQAGDPPATPVARVADEAPILPMWMRDNVTRVAAAQAAARSAGRFARRVALWVVSLPRLALMLVLWSPRGLGRATAALARWIYDQDSATLRKHLAAQRESGEYARVHSVRRANLHARLIMAGVAVLAVALPTLTWTAPRWLAAFVGCAVFVAVVKLIPGRGLGEVIAGAVAGVAVACVLPGLCALVPRPPLWPFLLVGTAGVPLLGWVGRPADKTFTPTSVAGLAAPPRLTAPLLCAALCTLGSSKMREADDIRLLTDVHRHGPGTQVDLELPGGVTATWVMERREELAAALRRELGTVWPSVGARHPGHLVVYVADQPMHQAAQPRWPLLGAQRIDIFEPQAFATDQRGRWVTLLLAYANGVVGAVPRMGKTISLRLILLIAAMDPRVRVYAFDGKGTGDLSPLAPIAHYVGVGDEPEEIAEQLEVMRGLRAEMRRRAKVISSLPHEECPDSKVTSELADKRALGLAPVVVGVDETQTWFQYGSRRVKPDKDIREEFEALVTDLVKRGPALGFWVFLASQQVNADTIPTAISNNAVIRLCLKIFGVTANDQVLGTGARKEGIDATMFGTAEKGIGYLRADGSDAQIVRVPYLDAPAVRKIAERLRAVRAGLGLLTGQAGDEVEVGQPQILDVALLDDVRAVLDAEQRRNMALPEILDALRLLRPQLYGPWDVTALGAALRGAGCRVGSVHVPDRGSAWGTKWSWLLAAPESDDTVAWGARPGKTPQAGGGGGSAA